MKTRIYVVVNLPLDECGEVFLATDDFDCAVQELCKPRPCPNDRFIQEWLDGVHVQDFKLGKLKAAINSSGAECMMQSLEIHSVDTGAGL